MTALAGMKLSTTRLADLPGNKMSTPGTSKFPYRKCLQIKVRRTAPSEHFLKASDKESSEDESSEDEEDLSTSRTVTTLHQTADVTSAFKPFTITIPSSTIPSNKIALTKPNQNASASDESSSSESSDDGCGLENNSNRIDPVSLRYHAFSEAHERRLLDDLIDIDEDEEWRVNGIQSEDEVYLMWKCGETRRTSKTGGDIPSNKRSKPNKSSALGKNPSSNQTPKKDPKTELFCGWETIYSKKPIQKLKEERKQRLSQPNAGLYANKLLTSSDRTGEAGAPFTFFHYTDVARYIQQYRANHKCENACAHHPGCNHEFSSLQEVRDLHFPFKFDLNTSSIRTRVASRGAMQNTRGGGYEPPTIDEQGNRTGHPVNPGYLSPVSFRPPYSFKSSSSDNWNCLPESPSRLKYQLKKIWRSYEQKSSNGAQGEARSLVAEEDAGFVANQRPLSNMSQPDDTMLTSVISNNNNKIDVINKTRLANENLIFHPADDFTNDVREKQLEYSSAISPMREMKLDESCLQVKEDKKNYSHHAGGSLLDFDETSKHFHIPGTESIVDVRTRYDLEKNKRMRSLIVSEINTIQRKQVISVEQKRKLDKFKEALGAMSNGAEILNGVGEGRAALPPNGSATKRFISGSVRAYYSRTTTGRLIDNFHTDMVRCDPDLEANSRSDDKPIIVVSQPHLRHLADKPKKPEPPILGKKLIGGRPADRGSKHPADAKQFTRITDLLRIKERQQSGRRALLSSAHSSSRGSASRKHRSSKIERNKRRAKGRPEEKRNEDKGHVSDVN